MKKAIKKLKKQLKVEVIELANAIKEDRKQITDLANTVSFIDNERDDISILCKHIQNKIDELEKQISDILTVLELIPTKAELQTIAKHVQNLEAEKEKNCSCYTNKPKAEFDKELFGKLFTENFQEESKEIKVNAVNEMMHKGKSIVDVMKESIRNAVAKATAKTIADVVIHTNTQKTDKNAIEGKQEGKSGYWTPLPHYIPIFKCNNKPETIVTNEMFNEELEKRLNESFIQDHPAFMLLNGFIPSNTIEDLIRAKLKSKGEHYSPNGDRYSNFKRLNNTTASFKQKTVEDRIENFMEKHEIWIEDFQAGDVNGTLLDLIESCIDVLNYFLLLEIYLKFNGEVKNG